MYVISISQRGITLTERKQLSAKQHESIAQHVLKHQTLWKYMNCNLHLQIVWWDRLGISNFEPWSLIPKLMDYYKTYRFFKHRWHRIHHCFWLTYVLKFPFAGGKPPPSPFARALICRDGRLSVREVARCSYYVDRKRDSCCKTNKLYWMKMHIMHIF